MRMKSFLPNYLLQLRMKKIFKRLQNRYIAKCFSTEKLSTQDHLGRDSWKNWYSLLVEIQVPTQELPRNYCVYKIIA
jgi:hypothetical protein